MIGISEYQRFVQKGRGAGQKEKNFAFEYDKRHSFAFISLILQIHKFVLLICFFGECVCETNIIRRRIIYVSCFGIALWRSGMSAFTAWHLAFIHRKSLALILCSCFASVVHTSESIRKTNICALVKYSVVLAARVHTS